MSSDLHMPSLTDAGSDAYQIRRAIERAYADIDHASLRARRARFPDLVAALDDIKVRLSLLRGTAEEERRAATPAEFRQGSARREQEQP